MIRTHNLSVGTDEGLYELMKNFGFKQIFNPNVVGRDSKVYFSLSNFILKISQPTILPR